MSDQAYHIPVMAAACLEALNIQPDGTYVDVTFGGGGHSRLILSRLSEKGRLIAFDQDADAAANLPDDPRFTFVPANFSHIRRFLRLHEALPVDGILADLGVSSHQIDAAERGFSFRFNAPLDMRMDRDNGIDAASLLNEIDETALTRIFRHYGELNNAARLSRMVMVARNKSPLRTTFDLKQALEPALPRDQQSKFLAKVFQAIRIEVNQEMKVLEDFLHQTPACLKPGGRLVVLAYHSLEDRPVKNFLRSGVIDGEETKDFFGNLIRPFTPLTAKAGKAEETEILSNSRARSARLRIGERNA